MEYTFFDIIDIIPQPAVVSDEYGIYALDFAAFWRALRTRKAKGDNQIYIPNLLHFMNTLGRNKSGSKNSVGRLPYFLNAFGQEFSLKLANADALEFIGDDHFGLVRGGTGTDDPDFRFTASTGYKCTLEAKMYFSRSSYDDVKATTNFHTADYCIAFIIESSEWLFSRKVDNYAALYTVEELTNTDPWLSEINLPTCITTTQFSVPNKKLKDLTDEELLKLVESTGFNVNFKFYENKTADFYKQRES